MDSYGACNECNRPLSKQGSRGPLCTECMAMHWNQPYPNMNYYSKMRQRVLQCLMAAVQAIMLAWFLLWANSVHAIEVSPPSPVPAMSPKIVMVEKILMKPTVVTVTYKTEDGKPTLLMVWAVVNGKIVFPSVVDDKVSMLTFSGPPGEYAVMGWECGVQTQEKVVIQEGDDPDPPPPPPPPPPKPGLRQVHVIYESSVDKNNPLFGLATTYLHQYCDETKHGYKLTDKDGEDYKENTPEWLVDYLKRASDAEIKIPFIVVSASLADGGTKYWVEAFPADGKKAVAIVKKHGG